MRRPTAPPTPATPPSFPQVRPVTLNPTHLDLFKVRQHIQLGKVQVREAVDSARAGASVREGGRWRGELAAGALPGGVQTPLPCQRRRPALRAPRHVGKQAEAVLAGSCLCSSGRSARPAPAAPAPLTGWQISGRPCRASQCGAGGRWWSRTLHRSRAARQPALQRSRWGTGPLPRAWCTPWPVGSKRGKQGQARVLACLHACLDFRACMTETELTT